MFSQTASPDLAHAVRVGSWNLPGFLAAPEKAHALVIFAHGSGSSRLSPRNRQVADALNRAGMATLLFDLLSPEEEAAQGRAKVFDIRLLAERLIDAVRWADEHWAIGLSKPSRSVFSAPARVPRRRW
jgi:putative phosphoribosyl transferase